MNEYTLRPYRDGDEIAIAELFTEVFQKKISPEFWVWKYLKCPYPLKKFLYVAEYQGKVVGHYGRRGLFINFMGKRKRVSHECDLMVLEEHQVGLSSLMSSKFEEALTDLNIDVRFGFPNENSSYLFFSRVGVNVAKIKTYMLSPFDNSTAIYLKNSDPDNFYTFIIEDETKITDENYAILWKGIAKKEFLSILKNYDYFQWRYINCPSEKYTIHSAFYNDELFGVIALKISGNVVSILDILVLEKNTKIAQSFLYQLISTYYKDKIVVFKGFDEWFLDIAFHGFVRNDFFSDFFFTKSANESERHIYENRVNWTVSMGDNDAF
jgi:hypothetical protein